MPPIKQTQAIYLWQLFELGNNMQWHALLPTLADVDRSLMTPPSPYIKLSLLRIALPSTAILGRTGGGGAGIAAGSSTPWKLLVPVEWGERPTTGA